MKLPPIALIALTLGGCAKSDPPAPVLAPSLVGTWTLTAHRTVITARDVPTRTTDRDLTTRRETLVFTPEGITTWFYNEAPSSRVLYTYAGGILVVNHGPGTGESRHVVSELTATRLVYTTTGEEALSYPNEQAVTTSTFTR